MYNGLKNFLFERLEILTRVFIGHTKREAKVLKLWEDFL